MTPYQQATASHSWGRWAQHPAAGPDYVTIDTVMPYETRALPTSAPIQQHQQHQHQHQQRQAAMTPQYVVAASSYGDSPVTPMSASTYGAAAGQAHFGEYGSYSQQPSPALASPYQHHQHQQQQQQQHHQHQHQHQTGRSSQRPMAPPTPPLDEDSRSTHSRSSQAYSAKCMSSSGGGSRRSPGTSASSVVKSEQQGGGGGAPKEPKTIRPFKKIDGTLQHEVNTDMDLLLKEIAKVMEIEGAKAGHHAQGSPPPPAAPATVAAAVAPVAVDSPMEEEVRAFAFPSHADTAESSPPFPGLTARGGFQQHMQPETQSGPPKKFKCDLPDCDRSFAQKAQKISHMNSHNGIKKYVSHVCVNPSTEPALWLTGGNSDAMNAEYVCRRRETCR